MQLRNEKVWRYMDFAKYVSLLNSSELYLSRADNFDDNFEGLLPKRVLNRLSEVWRMTPAKVLEFYNYCKQWVYINCWYKSEHESDAMWKLYSSNSYALAIQSTREKLESCLNDNYKLLDVQYIDYEKEDVRQIVFPTLYSNVV
ncbi:hypothetical protein [Carboxylicivirga marina]|uniref:DUF2971 domain-containing protein n=1 Tax=Carboxylicivirga marina TaxID=2800988 RepID=A0ABS1HQ93_9BACT|nr:hypothetical protein [Carboxylicivirga marina]MBK3519334.1 hypothetical protein [Carboxylicivirga marina]